MATSLLPRPGSATFQLLTVRSPAENARRSSGRGGRTQGCGATGHDRAPVDSPGGFFWVPTDKF
jgi:hypothetical protein